MRIPNDYAYRERQGGAGPAGLDRGERDLPAAGRGDRCDARDRPRPPGAVAAEFRQPHRGQGERHHPLGQDCQERDIKENNMNKTLKKIILQTALLASAIGTSIIAYDSDKIWLTLVAGCLIASYVEISNIENED